MYANLIAGQWREAERSITNINPSNIQDVIGHYAEATVDDLKEAVAAAKEAQSSWAQTTPQQRFNVLDWIGTEILNRKEKLGKLLAREEGKTLAEAMGEVGRAGFIFKYYAGEALRVEGSTHDSVRPGLEVLVTREPVGIIGLITPWNFPIAIPAWKIAPALAYGNAVILKPSELTPGCAWALSEIIASSDLPPGVFQMLMGPGNTVGSALVEHKDVHAISFTGSVETGRYIASRCGQRLCRVQLEMGGKNPLVVLDDADLDQAVAIALNGAFYSTGQRCTASSRLIVTEGIHDRFVNALKQKMSELKVGDPLDPQTQIGPLVDGNQFAKVRGYLELGVEEGATLFGGRTLEREHQGHFLEPALFTNTHNQMRINQEEIFGPVATIIKVRDYDEALAVANDTSFGLSAGIATSSLKYAKHFRRHAQAGMVMVNQPTAGVDYHVPFGGTKGSSYGTREQGTHAKDFYSVVKTTYQSA